MKLRKLELKDASLMLEWMHDESVVENLAANFAAKKIEDCEAFIKASLVDTENLNLAIADDNDEYMGTVSLKHIDRDYGCAEFAIAIRTVAMGKGFSKYAMAEIIRIAHEEMGLKRVYWYVSEKNLRAVRFYDKNGYKRIGFDELTMKAAEELKNLKGHLFYAADAEV